MRKKFWITIGLALLILAGLAGGWFYYFQIYHVNYLIKGVPYNGIYNLFFERADSTLISSMMDILGYWGDKRITLSQLLEKFPPPDITRKPAPPASIQDVKKFFEENGYETYYWTSTDSGKEIKEIKKFVNSVKKIPVVVYQKRSFDEESSAKAFRVVIGIFDRDKKVIVHDHNFGNNYEISYQDFEKMFRNDARVILAVWPSDKIKGQIAGPNYNAPYPSRLEAMDRVGNILAAEKAEAEKYWLLGDVEKSTALYQEAVEDANFKYFPRAFQVAVLEWLAKSYYRLGQIGKAIEILEKRVLPLNNNLKEDTRGWNVVYDKFFLPNFLLATYYLKEGKTDLAIANYQEAKKIAAVSAGFSELASWQIQQTFDPLDKAIAPFLPKTKK